MYLPDFLSRSPIWRGSEEQRLRAVMDNGAACARRARALAPLADDGRFRSLLAAANGDHAYQALVKAVATRTKGADLGAYAKELDNMELIGEDEDEQLVALNGRLVRYVSTRSRAVRRPCSTGQRAENPRCRCHSGMITFLKMTQLLSSR